MRPCSVAVREILRNSYNSTLILIFYFPLTKRESDHNSPMGIRFGVIVICIVSFWACSASEEYYTPNVDLFIFRHDSSLPYWEIDEWRRGFDIDGVNVVDYLFRFFSDSEPSLNTFQKQNQMVFNDSHVRAFIVTPHRGIDTTYSSVLPVLTGDRGQDQVDCSFDPFGPAIPVDLSDIGANPESAIILREEDGLSLYIPDVVVAGYNPDEPTFPEKKLYLTNYAGTNTTGREVSVDRNHLRIFFSEIVEPCSSRFGGGVGIGGLASLGDAERLTPANRLISYSSISSRYNSSSYSLGDIGLNLRLTISHELGHVFGLPHSFADDSCDTKDQGTTTRVMDYIDPREPKFPSVFAPCEQARYENLSGVFLDQKRVTYKVDGDKNVKGERKPRTDTVQSPLYRNLSTSNQIAVDEGRFEIIDADTYPRKNDETISKETVPVESLYGIRSIP